MRGLLATAALLIAVSPAASATGTPRLAVISPAPKFVVRGLNFKPRERVTVRLVGQTTSRAVVSASLTGGFRVSLAKPAALACGRFVIRAAGSLGSRVVVRFGPPECNPPGEGANR